MRRLILDTGAIFATVNRVDVNYFEEINPV